MNEKLTETQKEAVNNAKGRSSKKVLWWTLGIILVLVAIVTLVLIFYPTDKDGDSPVKAIIKKTKKAVDGVDIEAKARVAEAEGVAKDKVNEIRETMEIDDEDERNARLADLLR